MKKLSPKDRGKKRTLTLEEMEKLYQESKKYEAKPELHIIFKRKFPFISFGWYLSL